ncbi:RNA-binding protein YhbY [Aedoeadaptatus ivorii]|uniref:RNA-binding protein YhbY n=1 Tax=Aedoeadaptatus ivorii TaxID=54006 RepID=A0A3S4ZQF0_9FIRM|nr:ribosome assembly RNA-binding protein YhbY [Peptoniphilus ivorii]MDQ0507673.1 RNA-binding protein [Peptoniphilus ivorii]VEJ35383.1 RNA-binding protein YhbY [Peptoniphilus ivorii]
MITAKQRAQLKRLSHGMKPLMQIGKNGITPGVIEQIDALLEDHELVKITLLQNTSVEMQEATDALLEETGAEFVQSIGSKLTLYRASKEDPQIVLE